MRLYTLDIMKQTKSRFLKTKRREKYAVWIDNNDLDRLREYQERVGVPVSESVRRAIKEHLRTLVNRKSSQK
jgi:hypothetical protein